MSKIVTTVRLYKEQARRRQGTRRISSRGLKCKKTWVEVNMVPLITKHVQK